uniref:Uncharacterized protein n=1 Tax=Crocodylus porosus TaxID=8502 RepID=A0A7M4F452_CROPO
MSQPPPGDSGLLALCCLPAPGLTAKVYLLFSIKSPKCHVKLTTRLPQLTLATSIQKYSLLAIQYAGELDWPKINDEELDPDCDEPTEQAPVYAACSRGSGRVAPWGAGPSRGLGGGLTRPAPGSGLLPASKELTPSHHEPVYLQLCWGLAGGSAAAEGASSRLGLMLVCPPVSMGQSALSYLP